MRYVLGTIVSLLLVARADAGLIAHYAAPDGHVGLSIEAGSSGEARVIPDQGDLFSLFNASGNYIILRLHPDEAGRYEDYQALAADFVQKHGMAAALEALKKIRGDNTKYPAFVVKTKAAGTATIAGHTGTIYRLITRGEEHAWKQPEVVVSTEVQLRPLGMALSTYMTVDPEVADVSPERRNPYTTAIADLLRTGALLKHAEMSLVSMQQTEFSSGHFATPSKILTRDELLVRLVEAARARQQAEMSQPKQ